MQSQTTTPVFLTSGLLKKFRGSYTEAANKGALQPLPIRKCVPTPAPHRFPCAWPFGTRIVSLGSSTDEQEQGGAVTWTDPQVLVNMRRLKNSAPFAEKIAYT